MLVDINLLPEKEKRRSVLLMAALAILGAAVLFWVALFILSNSLSKETVTLEQQVASLQESQEAIRSDIHLSESGDSRKQLASTVDWAEAYQFDTVPLLHDLIRLLPKRGFFQTFDFTGPNLATVLVQFDTKADAAYYFARLQAAPSISTISLESVTIDEMSDDETNHSSDILPRYMATYTIEFVDGRVVAEGTADTDEESDDLNEGEEIDD